MRTRKQVVRCVDDGIPEYLRIMRPETELERDERHVRPLRSGESARRIPIALPMRVFHCSPVPGEMKALVKVLDKFGVGWEWIPQTDGESTVPVRVWGHPDALDCIGRLRYVRPRDADERLIPQAKPEECPGGSRPSVARLRERRTRRIR